MGSPFDTIVAPITPPGRGAVAWIRVSGEHAFQVAAQVFPAWPEQPESFRATYGRYVTGDDGLALVFAEGHGFTGEPAVELSLHGSPISVSALVQACLDAGARLAEPGEFSLRAFLNGKLDLTQAEAVRDTVEALTESQLRAAHHVRAGRLVQRLRELRERLYGVLATLEAHVDFSEELGEFPRQEQDAQLKSVARGFQELLAQGAASRILREGLTIALVGLPNAGKSSLMNALLGTERAIVTEVAGTTRDTLQEWLEIEGLPCRLIDTAGLQETDDVVEKIGIERTWQAAQSADLIWHLFDVTMGWQPGNDEIQKGLPAERTVLIGTKIDQIPAPDSVLGVSSLTGQGLALLKKSVVDRFATADWSSTTQIQARHEPLLRRALEGVAVAAEALSQDIPMDLASVGLHQALQSLGEITGETAHEDVLNEIFSRFCLGK